MSEKQENKTVTYSSSTDTSNVVVTMPDKLTPDETDDLRYFFEGILKRYERHARRAREQAAVETPDA